VFRGAVGPIALVVACMVFAAWGSFGSSPSATATRRAPAISTSSCGPKAGVAATGSPIRLGVIVTDQAGTSFTDIPNMAEAYFNCVNANGGVKGHRIKYYIETEQTNPTQIAADAKQLVQTDHVVGIVGNTSIIECSVDNAYWKSLGMFIIDSGIASECYGSANSAAVNMGPRFSSDGAAQYVIAKGAKKIAFDQSNVPGTGYNVGGIVAITKKDRIPLSQLTENVPIQDADSVALKEVDAAGPNGAVVLNFTPPDALVILQAVQKLGLINRVKYWACSTPCNTDFLAKSLGSAWNGKLFVNAELLPPDAFNTKTMQLYKAILKKYGAAVSGGIGAFSEMGFTEAETAVHALNTVKGAYTIHSVNAAFVGTNFKTGMLCQVWKYGHYKTHIPNNADFTVTPKNGKMVLAQGCQKISGFDPLMAHYRTQAGTAPYGSGHGY